MSKLLVLANEFPYGSWEPYMETEEQYYSSFDKVWIAALQLRKDHEKTKRDLKCDANVLPVLYKSRLFYLLNSITVLTDVQLYREISRLKRSGKFSFSRVKDLFVFLSRAHHEARVIDKELKDEDKKDILLYSYRFEYQPYVAILLKKKWKSSQYIVSRAHRYDLYEDQHANNYIPLRAYVLNSINYLYPCSEHGVKYIRDNYGTISAEVECKYLGTVDHGVHLVTRNSSKLRLVSCSNAVPVKRLDKIINALSLIKDFDVEWTHYGDGHLLDQLRELADEKLKDNVIVYFRGNIPNNELLNKYEEEDYDLFINVSSSEGLPVSIMEAMSFGIPCLATDVGGTKEIVTSNNGSLLGADVSDQELADTIKQWALMHSNKYMSHRSAARSSWEDKFDSEKNYRSFVKTLKSHQ